MQRTLGPVQLDLVAGEGMLCMRERITIIVFILTPPCHWVTECLVIHGHRTLKAPHPVRSAQLTGVPPS